MSKVTQWGRDRQEFILCAWRRSFHYNTKVDIYVKTEPFLTGFKGTFILHEILSIPGFPGSSDGKECACSAGDPGSILGLGRSSGEGNGTPVQYSCLGNPMDRGAWRAEVHGVSTSRTRLSDLTLTLSIQLWHLVVSLQCFNCCGFIIMCFNMIRYCCLVSQLCQTLLDPMDCSTPGFPVLHYLLEFPQTHVHWVDEAIQPSNPLLLPSPPAFNSQHQGLFQWVSSSHQVVKVLELQLQHQSLQWIFRADFL